MIKELEALNKSWEIANDGFSTAKQVQQLRYGIQLALKALTPPTAEEVCKALSERLKHKITYNKESMKFLLHHPNTILGRQTDDITGANTYHNTFAIVGRALPPHLITLIGRFYEGEMNK